MQPEREYQVDQFAVSDQSIALAYRAENPTNSKHGTHLPHLSVGETRSSRKFSVAMTEVPMLHVLEPADRIDLTNEAKTCIFNPDGVFGNDR